MAGLLSVGLPYRPAHSRIGDAFLWRVGDGSRHVMDEVRTTQTARQFALAGPSGRALGFGSPFQKAKSSSKWSLLKA